MTGSEACSSSPRSSCATRQAPTASPPNSRAEASEASEHDLGVCVDTAHAWAAGYDLSTPGAVEDTLAEFDAVWQAEGLASRSRAIREAMQEYVESHSRLEATTGDIAAVVAFDYEHDPVIRDLHTVQHEFQDVVTTTSHVHQGDWCLETVFCRGPAGRVRRLVYRLRDFDAVARVSVLSLSTDGREEHHGHDSVEESTE